MEVVFFWAGKLFNTRKELVLVYNWLRNVKNVLLKKKKKHQTTPNKMTYQDSYLRKEGTKVYMIGFWPKKKGCCATALEAGVGISTPEQQTKHRKPCNTPAALGLE